MGRWAELAPKAVCSMNHFQLLSAAFGCPTPVCQSCLLSLFFNRGGTWPPVTSPIRSRRPRSSPKLWIDLWWLWCLPAHTALANEQRHMRPHSVQSELYLRAQARSRSHLFALLLKETLLSHRRLGQSHSILTRRKYIYIHMGWKSCFPKGMILILNLT